MYLHRQRRSERSDFMDITMSALSDARSRVSDFICSLRTSIRHGEFLGYRPGGDTCTAMKHKPYRWCCLAFSILDLVLIMVLVIQWNQWNETNGMEPMEWNQWNGTNPMEPSDDLSDEMSCKLYIYDNMPCKSYCPIPSEKFDHGFNHYHMRHTARYWYLSLENHPMRTYNPDEADLFFVPHDEAWSDSFNDFYVESDGTKSNHLAVCTRPNRHGECTKGLFKQNNIIKFTTEIFKNKDRLNWYEIPYVPSFTENPEDGIDSNLNNEDRSNLITGLFGPRKGDSPTARLRAKLKEDCQRSNDCHFQDFINDSVGRMELYKDSVFALQPIGDSYSRKAVWDSLIMGAIPVVFHKNSLHHLKNDILEWDGSKHPIHILIDLQEVLEGEVSAIEVLQNVSPDRIQEIRRNIKRFIHRFSYYDFRFRYDGDGRKKDTIDWVLNHFCNALKA